MTVNSDQIQSLYDATVVDSDGTKVGGVGQVYLDDQSGEPSWVTVKTGLFGTSETFVPLQGAKVSGDQIQVPYTKDFIKDAPNIDGENHLDDTDQDNLFDYYNLGDGPGTDSNRTDSNRADANRTDGNAADAALTGRDRTDAAPAGTDLTDLTDADRAGTARNDSLGTAAAGTAAAGTAAAGTAAAGTAAAGTAATGSGDGYDRRDVDDAARAGTARDVSGTGVSGTGVSDTNVRDTDVRDTVSGTGVSGTGARDRGVADAAGDPTVTGAAAQTRPAADDQTKRVGSGRIRIRRHVVTEQQTITVPVEREVVEIVDERDGTTAGTVGDQNAGRHSDDVSGS